MICSISSSFLASRSFWAVIVWVAALGAGGGVYTTADILDSKGEAVGRAVGVTGMVSRAGGATTGAKELVAGSDIGA